MGYKYKGLEGQYEEHVTKAMTEIANAMIRYMESDTRIPIDTHNLKDALAVAIYKEGALTEFYMKKVATVPRNVGSLGDGGALFGADAITRLLNLGYTKYNTGWNLVLLSAMPYDIIQDSEGINKGWFSQNLTSEFESLVYQITTKYGGIEYEVI